MADWVSKRLDEIVEFNPRETIKKGVIAKKIAMDKLQPFCRDITEFELEPFSGGTKFRSGDTIMARITPCLENGKTAKVNILDDGEVGFGSTEYIVFRAREGVDADFVYYLISSPLVREPAIKSMVGSSGRQRVQTDVVQGITVMIPALGGQEAIAGILKLLDDKIAVNRKMSDNLEQQVQLLYENFITTIDEIPIDISKIIDVRDGTHDSPKPLEVGYPLITSKHLLPFGVDVITPNKISESDYNKVNERSKVDTNDILLSMIGTVGVVSLIIEEKINFAIKNVGLFKTSKCPQFTYYLLCYLKSKKTIQHIEKCLAGSTQKYISLTELRKMPIIIPNTVDINKFNDLVTPLFTLIIENVKENKVLTAIRDSLLPKLMSGELAVSDIDF